MEIARLKQTTTEEIVKHTKSIFARHGIPKTVVSDNGPQYSSHKFAEMYYFQQKTAIPYYPQRNGEAERALKSCSKRRKIRTIGLPSDTSQEWI